MSKKAEGFSLRFVLINTGNISRKVLSKVLRSFVKNFERLHADNVPELMDTFLKSANFEGTSVKESLEKIALTHIQFERIHPFKDGNGRVGRMILNQQLINNGLLPVTFSAKGKYRQAFRIYDRNKDTSSIVHIIGKAQEEAISRITQLDISLKKSLDINKGEQFEW